MNITHLLADGLLFVILGVGGVAGLMGFAWRRWRELVPYALMAGLTSLYVGKIMSLLYQPAGARPFIEKGMTAGAAYINNPGFPSDHTLLAGVVVLAVYFLTPYRKLAWVLGVLTLAMGAARVLALVHTPLDIAGGLLAASAGIIWYRAIKKA